MPISSTESNSTLDINQFSTGVEDVLKRLNNPSIATATGTPGRLLQERIGLLKGMVNDLNKPILKSMANDMLSVMSNWFNDPEVLCCLIQGIWAAYAAKNSDRKIEDQLTLADTDFSKFLDSLVAFVDFIIIFLTQDINKIVFLIPDLIKEIMGAIMGAVLLVIQETSFALRDSVISMIFEWIDTWDTEQTWSKCLPLKQMINVLKKYVKDYGLLADLLEKIKGFLGGMRKDFEKGKEIIPQAQDLEFLYWFRDLLIKLKKAILNFDFCVDYTFYNSSDEASQIHRKILGEKANIQSAINPVSNLNGTNSAQGNKQDYTIGPDGTILIDREANANGNWITKVSNNFLKEFINSEYGVPMEIVENTITRGSSADHIQGTNVTSDNNILLNRCANTPTTQELLRWVLNIKSR